MEPPSPADITRAYRSLYRGLLKAVQYATPARHIARDELRLAFRHHAATFDAVGVKRTLWFLQAAAREAGVEHHILKNLLRVKAVAKADALGWRGKLHESTLKADPMREGAALGFRHYRMTIAMLNKTMGLCLR
ncbi:complex 1 protein (LYR family) domain-containing protein [Ophiocordyceps camponoti-floridani]|uniref:Complex 1 protein (LYR family) domain-containing protein n=1 Tax=Ophiocordyceps camponoti-floridani TaxID=2030778 RepID=A0A8H4VC55_9HYPO|nr:complex 1 protein (LYR family) domain-containing protein [Ophiocordyceps camponoti-floridani]